MGTGLIALALQRGSLGLGPAGLPPLTPLPAPPLQMGWVAACTHPMACLRGWRGSSVPRHQLCVAAGKHYNTIKRPPPPPPMLLAVCTLYSSGCNLLPLSVSWYSHSYFRFDPSHVFESCSCCAVPDDVLCICCTLHLNSPDL